MSIDYLRKNEHDPLVKQWYLKKPWWDSFEQETKLAGRHRSKSTEPEMLSISLPRLCSAKSSLSRRLDDSDAFLGVSTVSGPRGSGTIVFDTAVEPHAKVPKSRIRASKYGGMRLFVGDGGTLLDTCVVLRAMDSHLRIQALACR